MASTVTELLRRRFGGKKSILPSGYTQLEYVASANRELQLTTFELGDVFDVDAVCDTIGGTQICIGYSSSAGTWVGVINSGYWALGTSAYLNIRATNRTTFTVSFQNEKAVLSANGQSTERSGAASLIIIRLFGMSGSYFYKGKIYDVKHYRNNILIGHFIPCTEDATSNVGFYDVVNNIFIQY